MNQASSTKLPALRDMFPALADDVLLAALEAKSQSLEDAIELLLEMCADSLQAFDASVLTESTGGSAAREPRCGSHNKSYSATPSKRQSKPTISTPATTPSGSSAPGWPPQTSAGGCAGGRQGTAQPRKMTWGQLRDDHLRPNAAHHHNQYSDPQASNPVCPRPASAGRPPGPPGPPLHASPEGPKYVAPGATGNARLAATDFPDLPPLATDPAATSRRSLLPRPIGCKLQPGAGATPERTPAACSGQSFTSASHKHAGVTMPTGGGGYAEAARQALMPTHGSVRPSRSWPCLAEAGGGADGEGESEAWQAAAVEELCRSHAWAGRDLVEAVCMALQYDLTEVVAALDELNAASYQQDDGEDDLYGGSSAASDSVSAAVSDSQDGGDDGDDNGDATLDFPAPRGGSATAPPAYGFAARPLGSGSNGGARRTRHRGGDTPTNDAYSRHRHDALKLTHAWRKKMDKAAAAFVVGDRAGGRRYVAEAQELRAQAAEAHKEAAERITEEMNRGRQMSEWELDLHGLHAHEAVEVVAKRIADLEATASKLPEGAVNAAPHARTGLRRCPGRSNGAAAAAKAPAGQSAAIDSDGGPRSAALEAVAASKAAKHLATRRVLRVIVGKGLHSSGGEASLPRVVQGYLLEKGYRFTALAGVIEVHLRRPYSINRTAATTSAAVAATITSGQRRQPK